MSCITAHEPLILILGNNTASITLNIVATPPALSMQPEKVEDALKRHTSCCYKMRTFLKQHYGGVGNCWATVEAPQEAGGAYSTNGFGSNQLSSGCRKRARDCSSRGHKCAMLRARKQGGIQRVMPAYGAEHVTMTTLDSARLGVRLRVGQATVSGVHLLPGQDACRTLVSHTRTSHAKVGSSTRGRYGKPRSSHEKHAGSIATTEEVLMLHKWMFEATASMASKAEVTLVVAPYKALLATRCNTDNQTQGGCCCVITCGAGTVDPEASVGASAAVGGGERVAWPLLQLATEYEWLPLCQTSVGERREKLRVYLKNLAKETAGAVLDIRVFNAGILGLSESVAMLQVLVEVAPRIKTLTLYIVDDGVTVPEQSGAPWQDAIHDVRFAMHPVGTDQGPPKKLRLPIPATDMTVPQRRVFELVDAARTGCPEAATWMQGGPTPVIKVYDSFRTLHQKAEKIYNRCFAKPLSSTGGTLMPIAFHAHGQSMPATFGGGERTCIKTHPVGMVACFSPDSFEGRVLVAPYPDASGMCSVSVKRDLLPLLNSFALPSAASGGFLPTVYIICRGGTVKYI